MDSYNSLYSTAFILYSTVLFQNLKATRYPSVGEWISKLWHIQTMEILVSTKKQWAYQAMKDMEEP